ncbi:carboxypeptidase regulatory-like domain-containing protein [Prevotella sp. P6B1]|uniref:TonB-dependent receptor n=1 Tax=Prevotella sp. P6B1 TaxID=1410613 RepID=UPI00056D355E|nr:carboxypeptidase regulatory-like domain-containing protein [Prevotella sp. P6B1]
MQKRLLFLVSLMLTFSLTLMAQITTSSMAGKVTLDNANGEEVIGATVVAVHEPSGTRYTAVTNTTGRFSINGMRTGGPYNVTISYIGFQPKTVKGITLQLAETYNLSVFLTEDATELAEVIVSGKASKFAAEKTGAATNINSSQITNLPTVSRSITDVTRLSPYGGNGMSFAGADGRTANFTVDGANFNNNFGLSDKLPGGGTPISIDAIEELQVVISPYDVRQTNFIGGGVNAITKSGTNTFKGSAYVYHQNENMRGDAVKRQQITGAREKAQTTTYGFTLGGPIIKNKLFFFVNGEMSKIPSIVNRWRGSEDGVADATNYISRTTNADLEAVSKYVANKYGYDTGSWTSFPADESNYKLMARMDWNITDRHHLAVRYNYTKNNIWNGPNATSMDGGTRMSGARMSQYSMAFANTMYSMENLVHSWSIDLNSRLTDNLSNQFLATISKLDDIRGTNSSAFPHIDITKDDDNYMALGYELFTWNNAVHNTIWNIKDDVTYYMGAHKIMAGFSFEHQMADNMYMRNGAGYYRFNITDDMYNANGVLNAAMLFGEEALPNGKYNLPEIFCLTYGYDGKSDPAARVQFNRPGFYAQDEWNVNDKFKLTYGLRIDGLFFNNSDLMTNGVYNPNYTGTLYDKNGKVATSSTYPLYDEKGDYVRSGILGLDYNGRHIDTGKWPKNSITFSPRLGFTYDVFGDKSLKVRGGTGIFSGRLPLVFFTNMPTNGGLVQYQAQVNAKNAAAKGFTMEEFSANKNGGKLITDVNEMITKLHSLGYPTTATPEDGSVPSTISAVDPKFKMPQVWKTSLAVDYQIPVDFPFSVTVEGIFNKKIYDNCISDWSIQNVGGFARFNGVDNRPIYPDNFRSGTPAFVLENTTKGYGWSANVTLNAQPADWISLMAAYTHTVSKEVTGMPGSNAESAFTYVPTSEGPNNIKLHNSQYVTPDRVVASATIHDKSGNHYNFVYEAWHGGNSYGWMLTNDMNGDGYKYDALYIPTDEQVANKEFRFKTEDDAKRFMDFVHNDSYLSKHQGEYAEPYSAYSPWVHRIDFGYKHDFKFNVGQTKHMLQLTFDVKNVLNFFNSAWGVAKYLNPEIGTESRCLKYEGVDRDGYAVFSTPSAINGNTKTWTTNYGLGQCWYASVGIKYYFN